MGVFRVREEVGEVGALAGGVAAAEPLDLAKDVAELFKALGLDDAEEAELTESLGGLRGDEGAESDIVVGGVGRASSRTTERGGASG
jgi:hypothetical protein